MLLRDVLLLAIIWFGIASSEMSIGNKDLLDKGDDKLQWAPPQWAVVAMKVYV